MPVLSADVAKNLTDPVFTASIETLLADKAMQAGIQGIDIVSLLNGETLFARNEDKAFMPASNNKLLTSCAALAILGKDYCFTTRVKSTARAKRGVLHGDLILIGCGDPILSIADLDSLAKQLAAAGVHRVTGTIHYDDRLFDSQRLGDGWAWDDEPAYYSAQISALNCGENTVEIQCTAGRKPGSVIHVRVSPQTRNITILNTASTSAVSTKESLIVDRVRGRNTITIGGLIPLQANTGIPSQVVSRISDYTPTVVAIENPSLFTAELFVQSLLKAGITVAHPDPVPASAAMHPIVTIAEHTSPPLSDLLVRLNKPSDNLIAECLMKTIGAKVKGHGTSGAEGTGELAAREYFKTVSLNLDQLQQADGSGLSRLNFVSPHNIVRLLSSMKTRPDFNCLYNSLPIAGVDGTLRNRMKHTTAENNCHAKSGYISHASALSGYVTTADGEMLAFSILMNNHLCSNRVCVAVQDKIVGLLADYKRPRVDK